MNSIMMIVAAVIAILLVFIIFSQDDHEEEQGDKFPTTLGMEKAAPVAPVPPTSGGVEPMGDNPQPPPVTPIDQFQGHSQEFPPAKEEIPTGSEQDLKFRLLLDDQMPTPKTAHVVQAVAAVVQFRFPEALNGDANAFISRLAKVETILDPDQAPFPFSVYLAGQTDRLLLFGFEEDRDDAIFEALVTAFDLTTRFKKLLEGDEALLQSKARISIGISFGLITRITRGIVGPITHAGKTVYLAETLAEAAGDFQIYVDEEIHRQSLPLFDFREWKPMKLRPPLPAVAFFEVIGWNKKEDIFAFANHKESFARRAVAVAYRYLDFDDMAPLLGLLADDDEKVTLEALATISEIGDERALGILKKILPDAKNPGLRSAIIEAFGKVGNQEIVPVLLASTKDTNWQVRFHAMRSLYKIAGNEAIKHIEHMTEDNNGAVRAAIHHILYNQYRTDNHLNALKELLMDLSLRARKAAAEALVEIATQTSLSLVAQSFTAQENDLRRHILRLFIRAKSSNLYQNFLNVFHDVDEKDRGEVIAAVRRARLTS